MVRRSRWAAFGSASLVAGISYVFLAGEGDAQFLWGGAIFLLTFSIATFAARRWSGRGDRLEQLFDHTSAALAYLDTQMRFVRVNSAFARASGVAADELPGRAMATCGFSPTLVDQCRRVAERGEAIALTDVAQLFPSFPQAPVWNCRIEPVFGDGARPTHILVNAIESTEQQRAAEAARRIEEGFRAVQDRMTDGLMICRDNGEIYEANAMAGVITGYSPEQLRTMSICDFDAAKEPCGSGSCCQVGMNFGTRWEAEWRHANGEWRTIEVAATRLPFGDGAMNLVSLRDVTDRKTAEEELRKREIRSRAIFQQGGMGVAVVTPSGYLAEFNSAMLAISGYRPQALATIPWCDLVPGVPCLDHIGSGDVTYTGRYTLLGGDGETRWVDLTLTPVHSEEGALEFVVAMLMDVTLAHEAELAVSQHERELEQANAWKTRFIATASHDIRQPLQAVMLLLHLLDSHPLDCAARTIVDRIDIAMRNLSDMVNSILDLSKFEAGMVVPEIVPVRLDDVLQVIDEEYRAIAESKGLIMRVESASDLWVQTDRRLFARVLGNLVSNAVRYTERGSVSVTLRATSDEIGIEVSDTGIGIPEGERQRVFEPFHQGKNATGNLHEGMGLGLAIVEQLARLLGLRVEMETQMGAGTRFTVVVPVAKDHGCESPVADLPARELVCAQTHVLVIDDEREIREGLQSLLHSDGYKVYAASSGEEALKILHARSILPSVIIADYRLQGGTGLDAIRRLHEVLGKRVPAILLTGDTHTAIRAEAAEQQCEVVIKPATAQRLRLAITSALDRRRTPRAKVREQ